MVDRTFQPIAVDLFAGCGGISEGFATAGFNVAAYLEKDHNACETLRTRALFRELNKQGRLVWYYRYFREELSREDLRLKFPDVSDVIECKVIEKEFGEHRYAELISKIRNALKVQSIPRVHVLLGGPPCQAYSLVGRSRDPERMEQDDRHFLYEHYLKVLEDLNRISFCSRMSPGS
jgi:DNA (cytosine-5)-methyltransferase 1